MEYNPFQHRDQTNYEALHAQEFIHMNNIIFLLDLEKKKKRSNYRPSQFYFQAKRANKTFNFLRLIKGRKAAVE